MTAAAALLALYVATVAPLGPDGGYCSPELPCPIRVADVVVWVPPMPAEAVEHGVDGLEWVCDHLVTAGYDCREVGR